MLLVRCIAGVLLLALVQPVLFCKRGKPHAPVVQKPSTPAAGKVVKEDTSLPAPVTSSSVPVLCYHKIKTGNRKTAVAYNVHPGEFRAHIKMLFDSGYHTILPDQLYKHITTGAALPAKPIIISFDDTHAEQYTIASKVLEQYGFKGVFFIMTVSIGRPNYMTSEQIKELSNNGHAIGSHTWNHQNLTKLTEANDWNIQITQPKEKLEKITGKPIEYFAYPFGLWNEAAIIQLRNRGIKAAFQLTGKRSAQYPVYTIRRQLVPGNWPAERLYKEMKVVFK